MSAYSEICVENFGSMLPVGWYQSSRTLSIIWSTKLFGAHQLATVLPFDKHRLCLLHVSQMYSGPLSASIVLIQVALKCKDAMPGMTSSSCANLLFDITISYSLCAGGCPV